MKKGTIAAAMLGAVFATAAMASPALAAWTELKAGANGHFVADAYINDTQVKALIDTGASVVAIPYAEAERMGLRPAFLDFDHTVSTANGQVKAAVVTLREVEIDGVVARDVKAMVLPEGALSHVLIGMSFLSRLRRYEVNGDTLRLVD